MHTVKHLTVSMQNEKKNSHQSNISQLYACYDNINGLIGHIYYYIEEVKRY